MANEVLSLQEGGGGTTSLEVTFMGSFNMGA